MRVALFALLLLLVAAPAIAASVENINMKTNEYFVIQFEVGNSNDIDLRTCVPTIQTSDLPLKDAFTFTPEVFNLPPGDDQTISGRLQNLSTGYYEGEVNVKCERYFDGELVDVADIIDPIVQPGYEIYVTPAGEGQDYVFIPLQQYMFIARPDTTKSAVFTVANTGSSRLPVNVQIPADSFGVIDVDPIQTTIPAGEQERFVINVDVPEDFDGLQTNLTIQLGDYTEQFPIVGERERFNLGGEAVAQNLFEGTVSAGNTEVPVWVVVLVIIGGTAYLYREKLFKRLKR